MSLEEIRAKYEHPIIGVIGACLPLPGYDRRTARSLGYQLRKLVDGRGSIFTGGVPGVGLDVYEGVIDFCIENSSDDRFFVLFPDTLTPSAEYFDLARYTPKGVLSVERFGKNLEGRRTGVGEIADALVLVNGSTGTIDEALKGLLFKKPLLCLQNSGGAADVMSRLKRGEIKKLDLDIDLGLIEAFGSTEQIENYLSAHFLNGNQAGA